MTEDFYYSNQNASKRARTKERILDEADKYGFRVPYDGTSEFYNDSAVKGYIAGARSERNKVLDELLQNLDRGYKDYVWYKHLREEISSLKVNP